MSRPMLAGPAAVMMLVSMSNAQVVLHTARVFVGSPSVQHNETAIIASPLNANYALVACQSGQGLSYAVTDSGFADYSGPALLPVPPDECWLVYVDPMVCASRFTGDLYLGGLGKPNNSIVLFRKALNAPLSEPPTDLGLVARCSIATAAPWDKPFVAIGPLAARRYHAAPGRGDGALRVLPLRGPATAAAFQAEPGRRARGERVGGRSGLP
jgi:hypothetical protein